MGRTTKDEEEKKRGGGKNQADAEENSDGEMLSGVDANTPLPLGIGTRVEVVGESEWNTGTVTGHWVVLPEEDRVKSGLPGDQVAAPYRVRFDLGASHLIMDHSKETIRESHTPPLQLSHKLGSRVECKVGADQEWLAGTIIQVHVDWVEKDTSPYVIHLDNGEHLLFWGPEDYIRESNTTSSMKRPRTGLRFKVGDRVSCSVGDGWADGTVIKLWWRRKEQFANEFVVPYQIQLDAGDQVYAPLDAEHCIRRSSTPPPHCWICFENDQSEGGVIVRECACRGGENGFVHVSCLVQLAQKKVEDDDPDPDGFNPFSACITCKQPFDMGSHCSSALRKAFYDAYKDRDIDDYWNKQATTSYAELLVSEEEYNKASDLLNERIFRIRLRLRIEQVTGAKFAHTVNGAYRMIDLANFLLDLADVYDEMDSMSEMKAALDESISLLKRVNGFEKGSKWNAIQLLAKHAYKSGDKNEALKHMEELAKVAPEETSDQFHSQSLIRCGNLNLECNNKQRGLEQITKGVDIMSTVFGKNHSSVRTAREYIHKIEQGLMDKLPSENLSTIL